MEDFFFELTIPEKREKKRVKIETKRKEGIFFFF